MKRLSARGAVRALLSAVAVLALTLGVASLPWYAERPATPPRVVSAVVGAGPLRAGAAEAAFALPPGVPIGGFARRMYGSEGLRDAVGARAIVLATPGCKVVVASADVLLVPEAIEAAVRGQVSDLDIDGLFVTATHTHAGPGGYWESSAGERIATGPYDPRIRDAIATVIAVAIRRANEALAPARAAVARGTAIDLVRSRSGGERDGRLTVLRVEREGGAPVAELVVFAAHPTILGGANRRISGDWPGRLVADGRRGTRVLVQGAIGDQSPAGPESVSPERFG
ncbi:MAG TPA: neutral/alkaline non-lysosomal ceramidase N-terminal domain-containing protein, partial [Anaeromyxobacter sp.]|nr:neutral/alkaline non-lysosomal ceramidase N-terminal domain-containing protein [Anaeromyxobacter sp.]